jgi:hypothetical protein
MAKRGRPPKTEDMHALVNRMLKTPDVSLGGKKMSRRDALVELLWRLVWVSQGKNSTALRYLLEYAGGKPVPSNQLPKDDDAKENDELSFIEKENFLDKLIAERKAEKDKVKAEKAKKEELKNKPDKIIKKDTTKGDATGEPSK